jgi:hypothetical protein
MSAINRTIFYDDIKGNLVFNDWTLVNTSLGQMIEPLIMNRFNTDGNAFDPADAMSKITELRRIDFNVLASAPPFSDGDTRIHGGALNPRTGF